MTMMTTLTRLTQAAAAAAGWWARKRSSQPSCAASTQLESMSNREMEELDVFHSEESHMWSMEALMEATAAGAATYGQLQMRG